MTTRGVERLLALVLALSLLSIVPTVAADLSQDVPAAEPWWAAVVVLAYVVLLGLLALQAVRPRGWSWPTWGLVVVGDVVFASYPLVADPAVDRTPWVLALSPITVGAGAVVLKLRGAVVLGLLHTALRGVLALTGAYPVPPVMFVLDALLLLVIVTAVSVVVQAVVQSSQQVTAARRAAEAAVADAAAARAREREDARWDAIVHDDVLASLSLAAHARSDADVLVARAAARTALDRLDRDPLPGPVPVGEVVHRLLAAVAQLHPSAAFEPGGAARLEHASVDPDVADALVDATAEAVRNAVRHGRPDGPNAPAVRVRVRARGARLVVEVRDDGVGFAPGARPQRLGLVVSVHGRTDAVGGTARVRSHPGVGTVVLLGVPALTSPGTAPA